VYSGLIRSKEAKLCDYHLAGALAGETGSRDEPEIAARDPWRRHSNLGPIETGVI
jgi:hypothetical protein